MQLRNGVDIESSTSIFLASIVASRHAPLFELESTLLAQFSTQLNGINLRIVTPMPAAFRLGLRQSMDSTHEYTSDGTV